MNFASQHAPEGLAFRTHIGRNGFIELREPWQRLESEARLEFYQTYDWYRCLLDHLAADVEEYLFVSASRGSSVLAIFPFQRKTETRLGFNYRLLELPSDPHVLIRDIAVHPDVANTDILAALISYLEKKAPAWDALRIGKIQANSSLDRLCAALEGPSRHTANAGSTYAIDCPSSAEDNMAHLSGHFRRNLRRLRKRAEGMGETKFVQCIEEGQVQQGLPLFFEVEHDSWKSEEGFSIASHQGLMDFYTALSQLRGPTHHCQINLLQVGRDTVAVQFGFRSHDTFHMLKIGYRQAFSDTAPGNLLLNDTIDHFTKVPDVKLISLVTSPEWAEKWKSREIPLVSHLIYRRSVRGAVANAGILAKSFLRKKRTEALQASAAQPENGEAGTERTSAERERVRQ